ncbi:MAG: DsrE family protein, partial [Rhodocyclaceae bacterium]|nr:DsrE family protein [Rhodocyclaceae bacterium]
KLARVFALVLLALSLSLSTARTFAQATPEPKVRMFINLSSVDPHRAALAMFIATSQAEAGVPVTVLLTIDAVRLAVKTPHPALASERADLDNAMKSGVRVIVNPRSLMYHGISDADLMDGVQKGNPKLLRETLSLPNTVTLSW